jgi:heptosyltransferase-2
MSRKAKPLPIPPGGFRDIAVIRLSSLGDVVLALPVVHALRRAFPEARLHFWVKEEYADVVSADPTVNHVRSLERDARRIEDLVSMSAELESCDLIVDLHASLRSRVLTFRQEAPVLRVRNQRWLRTRWVRARWTGPRPAEPVLRRYAATLARLGVDAGGAPRMSVPAEAEAWADSWRAEHTRHTKMVGFCPAAQHATKRWPEEHWLELLERLTGRGFVAVAFSLPREREQFPRLAQAIERAASAGWCVEPLPRQAALMGRLDAVITGDTGLMHVAAARGTRVVAMFGSTSPVLGFAPAGEGHVVLCRNEPCQPCTLHGREKCPLGHFRCMKELKPREVEAALDSIVGSPSKAVASDFR